MVEMIQAFVDRPVMPPKWDWQGETAEKIRAKFTPDYIFANYIAKAISVFSGLCPTLSPRLAPGFRWLKQVVCP
jgi:hypothetical protein